MSSQAREVVEDSKAVVAPLFITLKVVDQLENRFCYTIKRTDKLQVLMDVWYRQERPDLQHGAGTFWLEELCVAGRRMPEQLKMQDGDLIEFFEPQLGGGLAA